MNNETESFSYVLSLRGTNTTRENVNSPRLAELYEHTIESVALENTTSATTYARLFATNGVEESQQREWRTLSAGVLYYDNTLKFTTRPGEVVGVAFFGITANDLLTVYIRGKRRKVD